jgi:hypothetical protein
MAIVLVQFDTPIVDSAGRTFIARACGREGEDGLWQGWIEFEPADGGMTLRTPRETDQPNLKDIEYWATGLTFTYLEGALERAERPHETRPPRRVIDARPAFDGPAPPFAATATPGAAGSPVAHAVLDPFEVYVQGEDVLREQLGAMDEGHLRSIIRAHQLTGDGRLDLAVLGRAELSELIVAGVRARVG